MKILVIAVGGFFTVIAAAFLYFATFDFKIPDFKDCFEVKMHEIKVCPGSSSYVRLNQISNILQNAILVSEDASFYGHKGFDWFELRKSIEKNLAEGEYARGGSTITQQLAKNLFLSPDKSITRKLREAVYAVKLEKAHPKKKLFEIYLNVVEFGPNIYGVQKASRHYFQKPASQLNALEASFLAFLLPSPIKYSQSYRKGQLTDFARSRVNDILRRLWRFRKLSEGEYRLAQSYIDQFPWHGVSLEVVDTKSLIDGLPDDFIFSEEDAVEETVDTASGPLEIETEDIDVETEDLQEEIIE